MGNAALVSIARLEGASLGLDDGMSLFDDADVVVLEVSSLILLP